MKLLVGLGNPGPEYETTRHNAGFLVLDMLSDQCNITWGSERSKFRGDVGRGQVLGESCILLKPMTYMNRSGDAVARIMQFYKIPVADLAVFYDDVDVPQGKVRARAGGSSGGHKGVQSIIDCIGDDTFYRIKLGLGRPAQDADRPVNIDTSDWVLSQFTDDELKMLDEVMFPEAMLRLKGFFQQAQASTSSD